MAAAEAAVAVAAAVEAVVAVFGTGCRRPGYTHEPRECIAHMVLYCAVSGAVWRRDPLILWCRGGVV